MIKYKESFKLDNAGIVAIAQKSGELYQKSIKKKNQYNPAKFELEIEEILQHMQKAYGTDKECTLICNRHLLNTTVELRVNGVGINPLVSDDEEEGDELLFSNQILSMYGVEPSYSYIKNLNQNVITVQMTKKVVKRKSIYNILLAVFLAILTRVLLGFCPAGTITFVKDNIVSILFSKMTTIVGEIATFLVFLSVMTGITGVGNTATLGNMGKKLVASVAKTYLVAAVVLSGIAISLYPVTNTSSSGSNIVKDILQLVLDMIPNNLISCFAEDNDLQVIVLAIFIGAVLLSMDRKVTKLNEALIILSDVLNKMMAVVCTLLPLIVYFGILNMLLDEISEITKLYKVGIIFIGTAALIIIFLTIRVKRYTGIWVSKLFKLQWDTTIINLSTSSQVAAFSENVKCLKEKFGIDSNLVDFAVPLCLVAYMPCGTGFLAGTVYGLADLSSIPVDPTFIIKLAFLGIIVAIAAPPIPGSAFAVLPIMMAGTGVPDDYYSLAIVLGTVFGYFLPALNGYCMQLEMLIVSKKLNMIDDSVLGITK